ncbi:MAG: C2H2-type zinc finger protein [Candidatus Bathyarchaeia archaeon]|jgi:DNA-directed RNA polymerase subunit RPC12/RpoP
MKSEYKCPWCGSEFKTSQELFNHAKDHYAKCITVEEAGEIAVVTV